MIAKLIKKTALLFFAVSLVSIALCITIDPHNVFHVFSIRDTGVTTAQNYVKMKYLISNPDKFDSFIMGSSRVGNIFPGDIGTECYNLTYSEGVPYEHLSDLLILISNGIVPKHVFIGVDSFSYTDDYDRHPGIGYLSSYAYSIEHPLNFWKKYFNTSYCVDSFFRYSFGKSKDAGYASRFYEYGWDENWKGIENYSFEDAEPSIGDCDHLEETLRNISDIVEICEQNDIELTVFTNPMYWITYEQSVKQDYLVFLEKLAYITPYYNFSGYNDITVDSSYYLESSHYTPVVGKMIAECIVNGKATPELLEQGFGILVTRENVNHYINIIDNRGGECFVDSEK